MRPFGYRCEGDVVTLTMTRDDYHWMLLVIGYATGASMDNQRQLDAARGGIEFDNGFFYSVLGLANRLNEGNPNWTPYQIPEAKP